MTQLRVMLPDVSDISREDGNWLAGISDGEAFFVLATRRRRLERYPDRIYHGIQWTYGVTLRSDDHAVLKQIHSILKVGAVRSFDTAHVVTDPITLKTYHSKPRSIFRVYNRADIGRVVGTFERFPLRSKKARDFELWSKAWYLYQGALVIQPRKWFRKGIIDRPSFKKRQPLQSEMRRFYNIPAETWEEMDRLAAELKAGRQYVEPASGF